ncbi:MAG: COX15/CtaA family protein [Steroidobacteraceae bacterium]
MNAAVWIRRLAFAGVLLCLTVVVLGAYVRLTAAGLGCPDWPGCYGHLTPTQPADPGIPLDLGKAWREMGHRYAASALGLLILVIAALTISAREPRPVSTRFAVALLATVVFQGVLGMLTVTWQLKPVVVTLHLLFGLTTLALLWWLWLGVRRPSVAAGDAAPRVRFLVLLALIALAVQIALGGWTSSNYAAVACPDLPTCQHEWWPETDYEDAFVLWRGLGINYEGGVLEHPARVAIHLTHRLGAVVVSLLLALAAAAVLRQTALMRSRGAALGVLAALALQLAIGIFMVLEAFPLSLATAHNAGAALLVLATVALYRRLGEAP